MRAASNQSATRKVTLGKHQTRGYPPGLTLCKVGRSRAWNRQSSTLPAIFVASGMAGKGRYSRCSAPCSRRDETGPVRTGLRHLMRGRCCTLLL